MHPMVQLAHAVERAADFLPQRLLAEFRRSTATQAYSRDMLSLRTGSIAFGGRHIALPDREFEICAALGWYGALTSDALYELLAPEVDACFAGNRLRATMHRVRSRVGAECIQFSGTAYNLSPLISVDAKDDELLVRSASASGQLHAEDAVGLESIVARHFQSSTVQPAWPWFAPISARIEAIAREAALLLAHHALKCRRIHEAQRVARIVAERDPYDEAPREILIRSYLALGARTKAIREYREYERTLQLELRLSAPEFLRTLVAFA